MKWGHFRYLYILFINYIFYFIFITGDTNNNIKSIQAPQSVISLVVDVGNNNNNNNNTVTLPNSLTPTQTTYDEDSVGGKKRMLKRQKSNSSSSSNSIPTFLQTNSAVGEVSPNSAHHGGGNVGGGNSANSVSGGVTEPRKEARLLHYCPICNKGFKDRYSVNVHVRTHTGEKPFSCALCGKCFRQKAHLAKHHQTHAAKQTGLLPTGSSTQHSAGAKTENVSASVSAQPKTVQANTTTIVAQQQPQLTTSSTQPPTITTSATTHSVVAETMAHQTVSVSMAGNSNHLDKIVFPLSPVNVEIMEHT